MHFVVPSWVIPGTYLENLVFLADKPEINGVELLFFLYDRDVQTLLDIELPEIQNYMSRFTFTAHLPDMLKPEHEALVDQLIPLVEYYIVHPGPEEYAETQKTCICSWAKKYGMHRFILENTAPGRLEALLPQMPDEMGLCMDTGHLLMEGKSPAAFFQQYRTRIREIHLHSVDFAKAATDGRLADHRALHSGDSWLQSLIPELSRFTGTINLEVFSWEEAFASINLLR